MGLSISLLAIRNPWKPFSTEVHQFRRTGFYSRPRTTAKPCIGVLTHPKTDIDVEPFPIYHAVQSTPWTVGLDLHRGVGEERLYLLSMAKCTVDYLPRAR